MQSCKIKYFCHQSENPYSIIFVAVSLNKYLNKEKNQGKEAIQEEAQTMLFKAKIKTQILFKIDKIQNKYNKLKSKIRNTKDKMKTKSYKESIPCMK